MQKPTTSDPSFKNFIEGLKNTNVSAVGPRPVQVDQLQPQSEVVGSQTEGLNTLYKEEKDANKEQKEFYKLQKQHNLIQENQFKQIVKSLESLNKLFSAKTGVQNKKDGEGKEGKLDYKGLPDQAKDLTYSEVLKQGVAKVKGVGSSVKSMGKSIVSAFKDPASTVKSLYSNVKGSTKSMVENVKDIASTKENYTPEQERFAKAYAASAKGTQFQKGGKSALDAGSDKYDALKAKQEEINVVKEKMDVPASQGFDPLKKDVKELAKLENQFASIDPRVKKEEVLNNKVNTEVVKKERESEVTGGVGADKPVTVNQESDNVVSAPEAVAEGTKADLEVSKQLLETTREQLTVLKEIKEALAPETPKELTEQKSAPSATEKEGGGGSSLLGSLAEAAGDLLGRNKGAPGKGVPKGAGKPSLGSRMMGGIKDVANSKIGKLGGVLAVAGGAYSAYTGVSDASDEEEVKLAQIEEAKASGEISEGEAKKLTNETKEATVEKKGGAIGGGIGSAIGGMIGGTLGAVGGSFLMPGVGTVVGGVAGGAAGAAAGEAAGNYLGEKAGKLANFFGIGKEKEATPVKTPAVVPMETVAGKLVKSAGGGKIPGGGQITDPNAPGYNADAAEYQRDRQNIIAKDAKATPAKTPAVVPKETVDGKKAKYADDIKVASATSAGALSSDPQFDKDIREHRKQARDVELKKPDQNYLDTTPDTKPGTGNYLDATPDTKPSIKPDNYLAPAKATPVGSDVARTSTENADMGREASKGGANNTVVSNNVSTNNTTTHVPIKATPRAESQGSALDRYQNRVSSFG